MKNIRVLLTKIGFDGHDRGVRLVASAMRDAGMEVIYTGPWQTIEEVTETALQEDVDLIGISSLGYDHLLIPKLIKLLDQKKLNDVYVIVGGVIPPDEIADLKNAGVAEVFPPGMTLNSIIEFVTSKVAV